MPSALRRGLPAIAAAIAFGLYLQTMYPGLVSTGDSPKFQFVGRIWGTPHHPGYPLYVTISHLFSLLPIGTLAYRINLMSGVFGAATVWLTALVVRRLTGHAWAAAGAALALAAGRVFWSQAIIAEVYTLASTLIAATVFFLVRWADERRTRDLLLAVAAVALAVGNHLTILTLVPAFVIFVLATDWRAALTPRVASAASLILLAGIAQYGLILYWTAQQPAYLESSARNLRELAAVMSGAAHAQRLGWVDLPTLAERTGALTATLAAELRWWGVALAVTGIAILALRRWRVAVLLVAGAAGVWLFVLHYDVADPQVFLIPVFLIAAMAGGVALAAIAKRLDAHRSAVVRLAAAFVVATPAAAMITANYRASDHHRRTYETRLFDAIFRALPDRSAIVPGTFANELMFTYKIAGEGAAAGRDIRQSAGDPAVLRALRRDGFRLFAMADARDVVGRVGAVFEPVRLWDQPLPHFLNAMPAGRIVAIAGIGLAPAIQSGQGPLLPQIGGRASRLTRSDQYAAVGVRGATGDAIELIGEAADVRIAARQAIGPLAGGLPVEIRARSDLGGRIDVGGREVVAAPGAVTIAELSADGTVIRTAIADPSQGLRVSFEGDPELFEIVGLHECRDIANLGWQDATSMAAGGRIAVRIDNYRPFESVVRFVVAAGGTIAPRIVESAGPGTPAIALADASDALIRASGIARPASAGAVRFTLVEIRVNDEGQQQTLDVELGGAVAALAASATSDLPNPRRATICGR
jgi:hypothetical protein